MKTRPMYQVRNLGRYVILLSCAACFLALLAIAMPSASSGAGGLEKLKVMREENKISPDLRDILMKRKYTHIRAKVYGVGVEIESDYYIGVTYLFVLNKEEVGATTIIGVLPNNKVQGIFELAVARKLEIEAWGWEIEPPAGRRDLGDYPLYQIAKARLWDTSLVAITTPVEN